MTKDEKEKSAKKRQIVCLLLLAVLIGITAFIYIRYGKQMWTMLADVDKLKAWIGQFGPWSGVVFFAVRTLQTVVKIIPAEPLEIGSGLLFGAVGGMFLCLLGSVLGSIIILLITRKLGTKVLELFHLDDKLHSMKFLQDREKRNSLLFLFYIIPGTPKDVMTYFVGLTDMNLVEYMILASIARIPSIISSTICGAYLGEKNLPVAIGVFAATTVLSIIGGMVYKKLSARYAERKSQS